MSYASLIFIIFTALYILAAAAVIYHLKEYALPGYRAPKIVTAVFLALSGILWLSGLVFVFQL